MSLGTKINLMIAGVTIAVLAVAFGIIVSIDARSVKNQVLQDSTTVGEILRDDIERMFQEVYDQQKSLQSIVSRLSSVEGVKYIKVTGIDGYRVAATDINEIGNKVQGHDAELVTQAIKEGRELDVQNDAVAFFDLGRYIPVRLNEQGTSSDVIAVIEVEATTRSKSVSDMLASQKLLQAISASIEQGARSSIVLRAHHLGTIQSITDEIKHFDFFHDFIVFDNKLNVLASTDATKDEFVNDPQEYKQHREDVLFGKSREASYERVHEGQNVLVRTSPVELVINGKASTVGVLEIHVRTAAYQDKIMALILRMAGLGALFTITLIAALAFILRQMVVGPLTEYSRVAQKVSEGDLTQRISRVSDDEIGRFGGVFNAMVSNLYELDRLKTDFITVAAHQLRTPLSSVNWALKLLLDSEVGPVNEDQRGMLERGYETNTKMIKLVNDLLDVTRIEHGKFVYKFEANDFNQLLDTLIKSSELTAQEHNIEVRLEKHEEVPLFAFDMDKLSIALQNLVDNALKYTLPGGRVTIATKQKGNYLEVKVSDTGVGIPKEELPKIFSKFFRATNAVHLQTEGSGLGLVIAKSIIVRHGGQIDVDSIEGKGSTFTFTVPLLPELLPKNESISLEDKAGVLG